MCSGNIGTAAAIARQPPYSAQINVNKKKQNTPNKKKTKKVSTVDSARSNPIARLQTPGPSPVAVKGSARHSLQKQTALYRSTASKQLYAGGRSRMKKHTHYTTQMRAAMTSHPRDDTRVAHQKLGGDVGRQRQTLLWSINLARLTAVPHPASHRLPYPTLLHTPTPSLFTPSPLQFVPPFLSTGHLDPCVNVARPPDALPGSKIERARIIRPGHLSGGTFRVRQRQPVPVSFTNHRPKSPRRECQQPPTRLHPPTLSPLHTCIIGKVPAKV